MAAKKQKAAATRRRPQIRIIAGTHRGRRLTSPEDERIRPTTNRAREAIFNMLSHAEGGQSLLYGARIADIFCGTGAMGLEALSRGADFVTFVDHDTALTAENIEILGEAGKSELLTCAIENLPPTETPYQIVFLDPPYNQGFIEAGLKQLVDKDWLAPGALVIAEVSLKESFRLPPPLTFKEERIYGQSRFCFLEAK